MITLRPGSTDLHVRFLQRLLNNWLASQPRAGFLDEDSNYGPLTRGAVDAFQAAHPALGRNLQGDAADPTWRALGFVEEVSWPVPQVGQTTAMSCWAVAGALASGALASMMPGSASIDPTDGGLRPALANLQAWAESLHMRLVYPAPQAVEPVIAAVRRGPAILVGSWISAAGGLHAVVVSGFAAGSTPYTKMLRINNSAPMGRGSVEFSEYPGLMLQGTAMQAQVLLTK